MKEELDITVTLAEVIIQRAKPNEKKKKMHRRRNRWKFLGIQDCLYEPLEKTHQIPSYKSRQMLKFAEMIDRCVSAGLPRSHLPAYTIGRRSHLGENFCLSASHSSPSSTPSIPSVFTYSNFNSSNWPHFEEVLKDMKDYKCYIKLITNANSKKREITRVEDLTLEIEDKVGNLKKLRKENESRPKGVLRDKRKSEEDEEKSTLRCVRSDERSDERSEEQSDEFNTNSVRVPSFPPPVCPKQKNTEENLMSNQGPRAFPTPSSPPPLLPGRPNCWKKIRPLLRIR